MNYGTVFSGIDGFAVAFDSLGWSLKWQIEHDRFCNKVLTDKWPGVTRYADVRDVIANGDGPEPVDLVAGGDPCPSRSRARGDRPSKHPDLAGYFLALVGRSRPRWVVRENVRASNVLDFALGLEMLGYRAFAVELDARDFTSQSRRRQFVVGCPGERAAGFVRALSDAADGLGVGTSSPEETTPVAACVTAHPARVAAEDSYCWEPFSDAILATLPPAGQETGNYLHDGGRLRVLTPEECERLQGFPGGFTAGFSRSRRRVMLGNAVCVPCVRWLGEVIGQAETGANKELPQ